MSAVLHIATVRLPFITLRAAQLPDGRLAYLGFARSDGEMREALNALFPDAQLQESPAFAAAMQRLLTRWLGGEPVSVPLCLRGTPFQKKVWDMLLTVPRGHTISYQELARRTGRPDAVRAVANACGANPVAFLVPCHRILRSDGSIGGYAGGVEVKRRLLKMEAGMALSRAA